MKQLAGCFQLVRGRLGGRLMRLLLLEAGIFGESRNFRGIAPNHVWEWDDGIRVWGFMLSMITAV